MSSWLVWRRPRTGGTPRAAGARGCDTSCHSGHSQVAQATGSSACIRDVFRQVLPPVARLLEAVAPLKEAALRLERVLTNDPGLGLLRHADAGYDAAKDNIRRYGLWVPHIERASDGDAHNMSSTRND